MQYRPYKEKVDFLKSTMVTPEMFALRKRELRKQLRAGDLSKKTYERTLTPIMRESSDYQTKRYMILDDFFEQAFPFTVTYSQRDDVIGVLERD